MMFRSLKVLFLTVFLFSLPAYSETGEPVQKHPVDQQIEKLEAEDPSTHGLIRAYTTGLELWDKELNRVYQALIKALGKDDLAIKALKESQREWIKFRDLEIHWVSLLYGKKDGSMFRPMSAYSIMDITRQRALKLADRLRILSEM
ncbi:MAG TPA: DUF1311 domain-containing protein [Candidatus Ozemobacteraceae bacterium]|nr:DUF1311 domain-containing protein [Candidatus Ozemobacteraceae bacterium]